MDATEQLVGVLRPDVEGETRTIVTVSNHWNCPSLPPPVCCTLFLGPAYINVPKSGVHSLHWHPQNSESLWVCGF